MVMSRRSVNLTTLFVGMVVYVNGKMTHVLYTCIYRSSQRHQKPLLSPSTGADVPGEQLFICILFIYRSSERNQKPQLLPSTGADVPIEWLFIKKSEVPMED